MADPLTFALTQPELAARLVELQRTRAPGPAGDAAYCALIESVPLQSRADAHEFAVLTRLPVVWTQTDQVGEEAAEVRAPGFVRCWLEGTDGWRILGASGPVRLRAGPEDRLELRIDVAAPNAAHGFPVMVIVEEGPFSLQMVAQSSAGYLARHGLLDEEIPRTFLLALFLYLAPQLEQIVSWFRTPGQSLRFGKPAPVRAFQAVGLEVLDYPVAAA